MARGKTFQVNLSAIPQLAGKINKATEGYDKEIKRRVTRATDIIWRTAHAKRPMITKAQMKAEGRATRVSDPNAEAGVPVRTGALQASIKQYVKRTKLMSYMGFIETMGIPYAGFMEYGTSKVQARPFMRPAVFLNQEIIKRVFGVAVQSNLNA